jgi:hypothetical protein
MCYYVARKFLHYGGSHGMKLLALLETLKPLNEGIMDAMIETAIPEAINTLRDDIMSGNDSGVALELFRLHEYGDPHEEPDEPYEVVEAKYAEWVAEWSEARVNHAAYDIVNGMSYNRQAHMDGIVIYRVIKADENFPSNIDMRGLGEYWSWEEGAAEAHWAGDGDITYLIVGLVDPKHVDWAHSLYQNAHPSFDHEKELYIPEGSPIELYKLLLGNGDEIDPAKYGGRRQLAASIGEAVKLSGFGPDAGGTNHVESFMSDFIDNTEIHPLNNKSRIYDGVELQVAPRGGRIRLSGIGVIDTGALTRDKGEFGKGKGTKALKMILSLADKHGVEIELSAMTYKDKGMDENQLMRWYAKHGFEKYEYNAYSNNMKYKPRGIGESNVAYGARFARLSMLRESDERLARARAMGFDTSQIWYHGSAHGGIDKFEGDRDVAGNFTKDPEIAMFFANLKQKDIDALVANGDWTPEEAEGYGYNGKVLYPVFLRVKNVFDMRNPQHRKLVGAPDAAARGSYLTELEYSNRIYKAGFDAYVDYEDENSTDASIAVYDEKNIRSIHAKFEDGNSPSIMASIGESAGGQYGGRQQLAASVGESKVAYGARFARLSELRNEDDAARLARGQAMGFDTSKVWYHGTNRSFDAFSKGGDPVFNNAQQVLGYFFTGRSEYAGRYTHGDDPQMTDYRGGNIIPVFLRAKKLKVEEIDLIDDIESGDDWSFEDVEYYRDELIRDGYDGINFGNGYEVVIFDERNIRSIHAQFNDSNSDNLMASIGESVVREAFTDPYQLSSVMDTSSGGIGNLIGITSTFTDDSGGEYRLDAQRTGKTKAMKDKWKASAGMKGIRIPSRMGGIWELSLGKARPSDVGAGIRDNEFDDYSDAATGQGDAFRVFATVIEFLKRLKKKHSPEFISLKSKDTASRAGLYQKMAQRYAPQFGYEVVKSIQNGNFQRINLKRIENVVTESAGGQYVYHAAKAADFGSIMKNGLTFFNPSNWVKAGSPNKRYQDEPSVFAFEHPLDAWRWAAKMEWEFKEPAVVIKFNRGNTWEKDPSDDISLQMGKGGALESKEPIPASDIVGAKTVEQIGTPVSTGLHGEEYEQHVVDTLS